MSPIFAASISSSIFYLTRLTVLRRENSFDKAYISLPIFVGLTLLLNSFFIIYKGGKGIGLDDISEIMALLISLGIAILSTSKGVITDKEARDLKVGGEVICYVY